VKQAIVLAALTSGVSIWFGAAGALAQPHPAATGIHFQLARFTDITTQFGSGLFVNDGWEVKVFRHGNSYTYSGKKMGERGINLANGRLTKSDGKHFYQWHQAGTVYRIVWQPADPNYARVQVFDAGGNEMFNKLMWTPIGD
jgi:hypothetical protein